MGQRTQQGVNTLIASGIALMIAERFDTLFVAQGSRDAFVVMVGASLGTAFSVVLEILRQLLSRWATKNGIDLSKFIGTTTMLLIVAVALGCNTVPTSSEGSTTADEAHAKGGTITCAEGSGAPTAGPDGTVIPGQCAKGFIWADPPTSEETTGLVKVVEVLMSPFEILAEALARFVPGGE